MQVYDTSYERENGGPGLLAETLRKVHALLFASMVPRGRNRTSAPPRVHTP